MSGVSGRCKTVKLIGLLALLLLFGVSPVQAQKGQVPCTLAEQVDQTTFGLLGNYGESEVSQDYIASNYADCLVKALTRDLSGSPQLLARLVTLRKLYHQLTDAESTLALAMEGGGTMYSHGIPRSFPATETTLRTLAVLAGGKYGALVGPQFTVSIKYSREALATRLSQLESWKPNGGFSFDSASYRSALRNYGDTAKAIMKLLGTRNDAATAVGYLPLGTSLFVDGILHNPG